MELLHNVPDPLWNRIAESCDYATFFHTSQWAQVLNKTYGNACRIATKAFRFDGKNWIVLPLMEIDQECKGLFYELYGTVPGVYGGCIGSGIVEGSQLDQIVSRLQSFRVKRIKIFGNPYLQDLRTSLPSLRHVENFTQIIPLSEIRNEQGLKDIYSESVWRRIKQGMQEGFEIRPAHDLAEVRELHQVYARCLARWAEKATNDYPAALFENVFKLKSDNARVWIAKKDGKVVGGNINFYFKGKCNDWHHSCLSEYFKFGLSHLITHHLIRDAMERGFRVYDFNPSGGHRGTAEFKSSFGAVKKTFHSYEAVSDSRTYALYRKFRAYHGNAPLLLPLPELGNI